MPLVRGETIVSRIFALGAHVRYVAVAEGQDVAMCEREGLGGASSSDSDRYEELLVNPTLIGLARQRGEIDCGGLDYLVVRTPSGASSPTAPATCRWPWSPTPIPSPPRRTCWLSWGEAQDPTVPARPDGRAR
jgi:hypothetical protein